MPISRRFLPPLPRRLTKAESRSSQHRRMLRRKFACKAVFNKQGLSQAGLQGTELVRQAPVRSAWPLAVTRPSAARSLAFSLRRQILRFHRRICRYETIDTSIDHVFMSVVFNSVTTFMAMMPKAGWNAYTAARPAVRSGFCTIGAGIPQQTKRYGRFTGRDLKGSAP